MLSIDATSRCNFLSVISLNPRSSFPSSNFSSFDNDFWISGLSTIGALPKYRCNIDIPSAHISNAFDANNGSLMLTLKSLLLVALSDPPLKTCANSGAHVSGLKSTKGSFSLTTDSTSIALHI